METYEQEHINTYNALIHLLCIDIISSVEKF